MYSSQKNFMKNEEYVNEGHRFSFNYKGKTYSGRFYCLYGIPQSGYYFDLFEHVVVQVKKYWLWGPLVDRTEIWLLKRFWLNTFSLSSPMYGGVSVLIRGNYYFPKEATKIFVEKKVDEYFAEKEQQVAESERIKKMQLVHEV